MTRLVVVVVLLLASTLHATVLLPAEFREIVTGSQVIVHGRVTDLRADWVASDGRRRIETIVTVDVSTYLKGGPGETVTFRVPGGTVGRYRTTMVGAPEFREGEEIVLFLRSQGPAIPQVFGLSQGVYRVRVDPSTGQRQVVPPALIASTDAPETVRRGAATRRPVSLETFGAQVRAAIGGAAQ